MHFIVITKTFFSRPTELWSSGFAEVTGSNPVEALIFFRLLPCNCLNWEFTAMITLHFHLQPQYNMNCIYFTLFFLYKPERIRGDEMNNT